MRGYVTAKAARLDTYRAANSLLRLAVDGRLVLSIKPPGFFETYGGFNFLLADGRVYCSVQRLWLSFNRIAVSHSDALLFRLAVEEAKEEADMQRRAMHAEDSESEEDNDEQHSHSDSGSDDEGGHLGESSNPFALLGDQ